jgi:flagellar protein FlgJ
MLRLEGSANGRLQVRLYSSAFSQVVGEGWLPADDVGPADPPQQAVWTGSEPAPPAPAFPSHAAFIDAVAAAAQPTSASAPVSVTVAQAILESNWGESLLSREANNYFGIKATGQVGNDGAVWMPTLEYVAGGSFSVLAPFRAYRSLGDSVADHAQLFEKVNVYRAADQAVGDPDEFARRIAQAGYSTDPSYAQKVIDLMQRYDLYRFDAPQRARSSNATDSA